MALPFNPLSGKADNNTHPSSSSVDTFPGSLGERQARSYRPDESQHRGTLLAVGNGDGSAVGASLETIMADVLAELRALRLAMVLQGTAADLGDAIDRSLRV